MSEELLETVGDDGVDSEELDREFGVEPVAPLARVSGLLFVSPRPLSVSAIAHATELDEEEVLTALGTVRELYRDDVHGFSLSDAAGGVQFRSSPSVARYIRRNFPLKTRRLSKAALETLAVIAYRQPVQRGEIEEIRGVDALPTLRTLLDAGLIRVLGYEEVAGQPALYGTTTQFLERFGLRDLSELPPVRELAEVAADPGEEPASEEETD